MGLGCVKRSRKKFGIIAALLVFTYGLVLVIVLATFVPDALGKAWKWPVGFNG